MISTGNSNFPLSLVISPLWTILGKRRFVTSIGNGSISLAQIVLMPYLAAPSGNPPMPSNRLPMVIAVVSSTLLILMPPPARLSWWC